VKRDDVKALRALSVAELNTKAAETKEELFNLRFQLRTGQLADASRLRAVRRTYAALQTLINEKAKAQHGAA
jgi:large subunit ribosomal protein L29